MVSAAECYNRNGLPRFPVFRGLQTKILDTHPASGKQAIYEHKCQYCCKLRCDHVKTPKVLVAKNVSKNVSVWRNALDAACKWYSRSGLWLPLLYPDTMHPSHLWHPLRSTTATLTPLGVVIVFGGWVFVVSPVVLSSFKIKPPFANATTSSSSNYAACCDDVAKT